MAIAARIINVVVLVVVGIILAGIILSLLGANTGNAVVGFFVSAAAFLVGPFKDLFELGDNRVEVALNWGIAMLVYLAIGILLTRLLERAGDRRVGGGA